MNIRHKLALQFTLIVIGVLGSFSLIIYFQSSDYREDDFYQRLHSRALTSANLLLKVQQVDSNLQQIIDKNSFSLYDEKVAVFSPERKLLYAAQHKDRDYITPAEVEKALATDSIYKFKDGMREFLALRYHHNNQNYIVLVSAFDKFGYRKTENLRFILSIGFIIFSFISYLCGLYFASRALKPINKVIEEVNSINADNLDARLHSGNGKDELAKLALTFNELLGRLEQAFTIQNEFVANAAHELKTPFAIMLAELDYAASKLKKEDFAYGVIHRASADVKSLNSMTNALLELAQANLNRQLVIKQSLRIDEILWNLRDWYLEHNTGYNIDLSFDNINADDLEYFVLGNENLIHIAFKNIITNACKFSNDHRVKLVLAKDQNQFIIRFIDKGIGIPEEELLRIHQPFYRASNAKNHQGYGLGLPLTNKIISLHNGTLTVNSRIGKGTTVIVALPRNKDIDF